jgi:hypothetical protein
VRPRLSVIIGSSNPEIQRLESSLNAVLGKVAVRNAPETFLPDISVGSRLVANLRTATAAGAGAISCVTDATATTPRSTVAGGGANTVMVFSDGTNWLIL